MKIIHCADLHLDSRMETHLTTKQASKRRFELLMTFERMVSYAVEAGVSVIIIAGDLFDTSTGRGKKIKSRVLDVIRSAPGIDFLYLRGNHDKDDSFCSADNKPDNLKFFGRKWITYTYGSVCITGLEVHDSSDIDSSIGLREENVNIVVLHGQESRYDNKNDAYIIPLNNLKNQYIDYLALGHIHDYRYKKLDNRGAYCYCGCLEGRGFDECGEKGFVLLDISGRNITHRFIPFASRTCYEIQVPIQDAVSEHDIMSKVEEALAGVEAKSLVRLLLCGEIPDSLEVDTNYISNHLEGRFFFLMVKDHTRVRIRYEDYANDISLKGEFIRQVQQLDCSEEDKSRIIMTGIRTLMGRELNE